MQSPPYASASLYVGDLVSDVTEATLFEIFNQVGPVASIRVCRDHNTRRSLGYAYVNFHNSVDAERALDTLNFSPIKGKPCRIMWSHRDPSIRKSGKGNIFIKNLDALIDNKALYDTFSAFGNILSCKVATDDKGDSKGYGFVHFESEDAAQMAADKVNGMELNGKEVFVGPFIPRKDRQTPNSEQTFTNVYVKSLDENVTEEMLQQEFSAFGGVVSCVIMRDAEGKSRGFGFVNMDTHENASRAVAALNSKELNGKAIYAGRAQKKVERESELRSKFEALKMERLNKYQGVNLYVKNLSDVIDDDRLRAEFERFGNITSAKVMRDDKGMSRGFGFVCFSNADEATKAVAEMSGRMLDAKPLYVALAQRKEVRRAQLEAQLQRAQYRGMQPGPMGPQAPMYGQPMFYAPPGMPPRAPGAGFMYPQQMMPRPRWAPPQGAPRAYPAMPYAVMPAMPPRQARGPARGRGMPAPAPAPRPGPPAPVPPTGRGMPPAGRGPGFKYNTNVRNRDAGMMPGMMEPLTSTALASATIEQQKQMLGERLYPLVHQSQPQPDVAAKITGMLLEMDNTELVHLVESPDALKAKIGEAIAVLQAHQAQVMPPMEPEGGAQ